jgi:hypothetical protein
MREGGDRESGQIFYHKLILIFFFMKSGFLQATYVFIFY